MISETPQLRDILGHDGNLLILGGPGSGKTTSAILKAKSLISTLDEYQKILFLSFSNGAIFQVRQKAKELLTKEEFKRLHIQTYHSFCFSLIKSYGSAFGVKKPAQILPPEEQIIAVARQLVPDIDAYLESQCFEEGRICFEKMPELVNSLLENKEVLEVIQSRYPIVVIDEFQDSTNEEWDMLEKVAEGLTVIALADPQQRIYAWRPGASEHRIQEFRNTFTPLEIDLQGENHRSPESGILEYADSIRDATARPACPNVMILPYAGPNHVSFNLKNAILTLRRELTPTLGHSPTIAILTGKNKSALFLSNALNKKTGRISFPIKHELILDSDGIITAQRFIARILENASSLEESTANAFEDLGNFCLVTNSNNARAPKEEADQLFQYAEQIRARSQPRLRVFVSALPRIIELIRNEMTGNIESDWNMALQKTNDWAEERFPLLQNYLNGKNPFYSQHITKKLNESFEVGGYKTILDCLNRVHLGSRVVGSAKPKYSVSVMTMHKSKGKEYDAVILFDHYMTHPLMLPRQTEQENRLLVRVAITRARHRVNIIHSRQNPPYFLN